MSDKMDSIYINSSTEDFFDTLPELQQKLLLFIGENPGIRYRELLRLINSSNGVLSYHINKLEKMELVNVDRKSRITRFFPRNISNEIMVLLGILRNQTSYEIMKLLYESGPVSQSEIVKYTRKSASTISWYIKKLLRDNIIYIKNKQGTYDGNNDISYKMQLTGKRVNSYDLSNRNLVSDVMNKANKYIERTIDNYSSVIDSL
ncbi:MAG: winged helix-turn-helix transcriptional regulator [Thermoproteota archaeon]|nr:winged helix-turn-helix transcriptional regulator [Thermoproteota archaeon]